MAVCLDTSTWIIEFGHKMATVEATSRHSSVNSPAESDTDTNKTEQRQLISTSSEIVVEIVAGMNDVDGGEDVVLKSRLARKHQYRPELDGLRAFAVTLVSSAQMKGDKS